MPNEIQLKPTSGAFTLAFGGTAAGASVASSLITNSGNNPAANIFVKIRSGSSAPAANTVYRIRLKRSNGTIADTNANAPVLGVIVVTNDASTDFSKSFSTSALGPLGSSWGIIAENATDQTVDATDGNHDFDYEYLIPEVQ